MTADEEEMAGIAAQLRAGHDMLPFMTGSARGQRAFLQIAAG